MAFAQMVCQHVGKDHPSMLAVAAIALAIPLHFEPNMGQAARPIRYVGVAGQYSLLLSNSEIALRFGEGDELRMSFPAAAGIEPVDRLPGQTHYGTLQRGGNNNAAVPNYAAVRYRSVFPGIDLTLYEREGRLEYDWIVAANADPASIGFRLAGMARPSLDEQGRLIVKTRAGVIRQEAPAIYQEYDGVRVPVRGTFFIRSNAKVGFRIGPYDKRRPLIIDPSFVFSSGIGGSGALISGFHASESFVPDQATRIAVDASGNIYVAGGSASRNFPFTNSSGAIPGDQFAFLAKFAPDGKTILYSTFISTGGPPTVLSDPVRCALAVDASGTAYVAGATGSSIYFNTSDAFLAKVGPDGAVQATMIFGGSSWDAVGSIAIGADGKLYLIGATMSSDFPVSAGAYRTTVPPNSGVNFISSSVGFVIKMDPAAFTGSQSWAAAVIYSTYLGDGTGGGSIAADAAGNAYFAGGVQNAGLPVSSNAFQTQCRGGTASQPCLDSMVFKLNASGSSLLYSTYLGGSGIDFVTGLALDSQGNLYLTGVTDSDDFPVTPGAYKTTRDPQPLNGTSGFVAKLSPNADKLIYSTYIAALPAAIAIDRSTNAYVVGSAPTSGGLPVVQAFQTAPYSFVCMYLAPAPSVQAYCQDSGFISVLNASGSSLLWSTYLGGGKSNNTYLSHAEAQAVTLDSAGNVYVAGRGIALTPDRPTGSPSNDASFVKIAPGGSPPQMLGITNSAGFRPGLPAPGGLASLFVSGMDLSASAVASGLPLPKNLAGVSVFVDGVPAPILAVSVLPPGSAGTAMQQVNFQVPYEVPENLNIRSRVVELRFGGQSAFAEPPYVAPGIFTDAVGNGIVQHAADYTLVTKTNPVRRGEIVIVYASGLGPVDQTVSSGSAAAGASAVLPACGYPTVSIGDVLYAGLTPGFAGLYQLNVRVSEALVPGDNNLYIQGGRCWQAFPGDSLLKGNSVVIPVQ